MKTAVITGASADHGAHGRFDARAKRHSIQLKLTMNRAAVLLSR